jgi:hypothetical protein
MDLPNKKMINPSESVRSESLKARLEEIEIGLEITLDG